jgi:secernin
MCDTFAIGRSLTKGGTSIFAKNSDREADEVQIVVSLPRKEYPKGEDLTCTYLSIPQTDHTNAVLLSKPFWLWGAEMGVNEKGVVIGNEALFTKMKPEKKPGLIGMDLLRLALERGDSAGEAIEVIIEHLQRHGQGGACGYRDKGFAYMNSFLIMDRSEMIVLETVGRDYAAQYYKNRAAISNKITLGEQWERSSLERGTDMGRFSDRLITYFSGSRFRRSTVLQCIGDQGGLDAGDAFGILRRHRGSMPFQGINQDVCMHASDPFVRKSHTTGSLVVELDSSSGFRIFVTGGSSPCLTPFKPVLPEAMPAHLGTGGARYEETSFWWRNEAFRIQAEMRMSKVHEPILKEIRELEDRFCRNVPLYPWHSRDEALCSMSSDAFSESSRLAERWTGLMKEKDKDYHPVHNAFWTKIARRGGVPLL